MCMGKRTIDIFEIDLAKKLGRVDLLLGGNDEDRSAHFGIKAADFSGVRPAFVDNTEFLLRQNGGILGWRGKPRFKPDTIDDYVRDYGLLGMSKKFEEMESSLGHSFPEFRKTYYQNLMLSLDMMVATMLAVAHGRELPSYDARYKAATTFDNPQKIDERKAREKLREALINAKYDAKGEKIRDAFLKWLSDNAISKEDIPEQALRIGQKLLQYAKTRLFSELEVADIDLRQIGLGFYQFNGVSDRPYIAFSSYNGGTTIKGKPALSGSLAINTDFPATVPGLYHLLSHETVPGHFTKSAISDLRWRQGQLGFEGTLVTLCTPSTVLNEGMAQNGLELLFGSREEAVKSLAKNDTRLADGLRVYLAHADLLDIALYNASLMRQKLNNDMPHLTSYLEQDCVLPPHLVDMTLKWAQDPILGPMQGPAYYLGKNIVRDAIKTYKPLKVAPIGLDAVGDAHDIQTFQKVFRASEN